MLAVKRRRIIFLCLHSWTRFYGWSTGAQLARRQLVNVAHWHLEILNLILREYLLRLVVVYYVNLVAHNKRWMILPHAVCVRPAVVRCMHHLLRLLITSRFLLVSLRPVSFLLRHINEVASIPLPLGLMQVVFACTRVLLIGHVVFVADEQAPARI